MSRAFEEDLQEIVRRIVRVCDPEQVVLFGSRASGMSTEVSDVDLLVIERSPFTKGRSRFAEIVRIEHAMGRIKVPVDVLVFDTEEVQRWRHSPRHIIGRALRDGEVVYERH